MSATGGWAQGRTGCALLVALLLLAACGDDDASDRAADGGQRPPGATTEAAGDGACEPSPGVTDDSVRVGGLFPTTGPEGQFFAAVQPGIEARFAAENDAGGVDGRLLELVHADDGDGEIANAGAARHLVETEAVFGLIEVSTSGEGGAAYLHDNGVPVVGWAITPSWGRFDNMFGYRHSTSPDPGGGRPVSTAVALVDHFGGARLAIFAGGTSAAINQADHARVTAEELGVEVVYQNPAVPLGSEDFSVEAERVLESEADSIYLALQTMASVNLLTALRDASVQPEVVVMGAGYDARVPQAFGDVIDGAIIPIDWRPFELPVPAHDTFRRWLAEAEPEAFPGQLPMVGWLSADVFIRGLQEAGGCLTRSAFVDGLRSVDDHTAAGLLPPTDYSEEFGQLPRCFWYVQVVGAAFEPVVDDPVCGLDVPPELGES